MADGAGQIAEVHVSRTDKTRPRWVKLLESPSNYKEEHNHGKRPLRDENGDYVRVPVEGEFFRDGRQKTRIVYVECDGCDLPPGPRRDLGLFSNCHWTESSAWASSGQARCGCPLCTDRDWRRQENRKDRREGKRQARDWQREY